MLDICIMGADLTDFCVSMTLAFLAGLGCMDSSPHAWGADAASDDARNLLCLLLPLLLSSEDSLPLLLQVCLIVLLLFCFPDAEEERLS